MIAIDQEGTTVSVDDVLAELPPYRALLVVDTKGFGSNPDATQAMMSAAIPDVLSQAFAGAGLGEIWETALFPHGTGDGYGLGFDPRFLPAVVTRFFDELQTVLAARDARLRSAARSVRLRMRASLNVGPILAPAPGTTSAAAIGSAAITTHRLLDAAPVRAVLERSDPDQTFLAVALSQRVFEDVLASEYAKLPATKVVPADVSVKEYCGTIYLYIPNPSGDLLRYGYGAGGYAEDLAVAKAKIEPPPPGSTTNVISGTQNGTAIQVGHVHGDLRHR
ncbi:hypothetical protein Amsp01_063360 [Amycolatopsis sp. NBRC 101858]|uniref:hypothetical protein n=1 Tax=Amycolatopsis sp. NBRC 101858 TaxID=3032200 RepID=UPI0024A29384|nr:hypothetical protein [Amycolatopsis sp. NBRC 101858]GLY40313.1 hypothetical protein Amsp01_063360 [Amycolatopsis sp. NBRC 101858]